MPRHAASCRISRRQGASRGDAPVPPASAIECAPPAAEKAGKRRVPDAADVRDIAALPKLGEWAVRTLLRDIGGGSGQPLQRLKCLPRQARRR